MRRIDADILLVCNTDHSTPIEAVLLIPMSRINFGKVGTFTDGE